MDLTQFRDLYASEAREHLARLSRALLSIESEDAALGVAEAFRAAHTLKGLAGTMGHATPAKRAHALEERLAELRDHGASPEPALVDTLLRMADDVEVAILASLDMTPDAAAPAADEEDATAPTVVSTMPTALAVRVRLVRDAPVKAARAVLITRAVERVAPLLGTEPASFGDSFGGEFFLFVEPSADRDALEAAIRGAGDVERVAFELPTEPPATKPAASAPGAGLRKEVRVEQRHLDELSATIGELNILHARLASLSNGRDGATLTKIDEMAKLLRHLHLEVLSLRMVPVGDIFDRFPRQVRDLARSLDKEVELRMVGRDIRIDRAILDEIAEPLVHLIRNSVDHGLETPAERELVGKPRRGSITLRADRERNSVRIELSDDGRGVAVEKVFARARAAGLVPEGEGEELADDELLRLLSHPGFSTADQVTGVSGRGVGLDAVVTKVRGVGGAIDMQTVPGEGTSFVLRLPVTLAMVQALRVRVADEDYAIPITHVREAIDFLDVPPERVGTAEVLHVREERAPLVRLREVLGSGGTGEERAAVLAESGERRAALAVDALIGREQIVIKAYDVPKGALPIFSGVTLLGDGRPVLVLDPLSVL